MATSQQRAEAHLDFDRYYKQGIRKRALRQIRRQTTQLRDLSTTLQEAETEQIADRGMQTIRIDQIQGSVADNRNFDSEFLPTRKSLRHRWANILVAYMGDQGLPAIKVIQVGDVYFVVDGHHRVSVARFVGQVYIDAHVVEHFVTDSKSAQAEASLSGSDRIIIDEAPYHLANA